MPDFTSEMFRKYVPQTIVMIPTSFSGVGTSWRRRKPNNVAKTGVNEEIGAIRDIGESFTAQVPAINAKISKILTKMRSQINVSVN